MMYCELKHNQYWVWSSRLASLDCMPQYKVVADSANDALLVVCGIKQIVAQSKARIDKSERYAATRRLWQLNNKGKQQEQIKNNSLYSWAKNLNS